MQQMRKLPIRKTFSYLGTAAGFVTALASVSFAQFTDVSVPAGLSTEIRRSYGNPVWGDINNDGFLDLIVPTHQLSPDLSTPPFVYRNNGNGTFTNIQSTSGITGLSNQRDWHGFSFGDYDGDGNLDLYVAIGALQGSLVKTDILFKGHGDGTFENVSQSAGIQTAIDRGRGASWVDYDNDGKLDLLVKNFEGANRLYKNNGDGTFTQVAGAAGLATATKGTDEGWICSFADYNNDGLMDVAISGVGTKETLYMQNSDHTFTDVTAAAGLKPRNPTRGIAWGDYNNDGLLDLYVARGSDRGSNFGNSLYRNNGDGTFTDVTAAAGVSSGSNNWVAVWGDYDNDGFLDLFITCPGTTAFGSGNANILYHNNGNGTFTNVATSQGVALNDNLVTSAHKTAAWGDYNNDGFLDLIIKDGIGQEGAGGPAATGIHRLFKNNGNSNHFIKVNLTGVQSNRGGIGARVTVTYTGGMAYRQNNGGGGGEFCSQGSEPLHFGIGTATTATVQVIWPSGVVDTLPSVAANATITVVEGSSP